MTPRVELVGGWEVRLDDLTKPVMEEVVANVVDGAVRLVPVDSGDLRDSIVGETKNPEPGIVLGRVSAGDPEIGKTMDYAEVVENGRDDMPNYPKQPYLRPALYQYQGHTL